MLDFDFRRGWIKRRFLKRLRKIKEPYIRDFNIMGGIVSNQVKSVRELKDDLVLLKKWRPHVHKEIRAFICLLSFTGAIGLLGSLYLDLQGRPEEAIYLNLSIIILIVIILFILAIRLKP